MNELKILFKCPDNNAAIGGIKKIYDQVDILNKYGINAYVMHIAKGFRCDWFENNTKVISEQEVELNIDDIIVLAEVYGPDMCDFVPGLKKVVFNQNAFKTFLGYSLDPVNMKTPYNHEDYVAAIVVSDDNKKYLNYVFPELPVHRLHNSINFDIFSYTEKKKKQICFMPRKNHLDALQVFNILKFRGKLEGYEVVLIDNMNEAQVAEVFKESLIFLCLGYHEGSPLPPLEAKACGCLVVGYDGFGGNDHINDEQSFPVKTADIIDFANQAEKALDGWEKTPHLMLEKVRKSYDYVKTYHSKENEEKDIFKGLEQYFKVYLDKQKGKEMSIQNLVKKFTMIFILILSFGIFLPVHAIVLNGNVEKNWTVGAAQEEALNGIQYNRDVSWASPVDENYIENRLAINNNIQRIKNRRITSFDNDAYGVRYYKNNALDSKGYYYSKGSLYAIDYFTDNSENNFPSKIYKYSYPEGKLISVSIEVAEHNTYVFRASGEFLAHWVYDTCYDVNGNIISKRHFHLE